MTITYYNLWCSGAPSAPRDQKRGGLGAVRMGCGGSSAAAEASADPAQFWSGWSSPNESCMALSNGFSLPRVLSGMPFCEFWSSVCFRSGLSTVRLHYCYYYYYY